MWHYQELSHSNNREYTFSNKKVAINIYRHYFADIRLPFPNFVCGEYDDDSNYGVIVLEDLYSSGHSLDDTELQRISNQIRIENVIQRLAEFHATSAAYERSAFGVHILNPIANIIF